MLDRSADPAEQTRPEGRAAIVFDLPAAVGNHYGFMHALARDHARPLWS